MQAIIATMIALAVLAIGAVEAYQHGGSLFATSKSSSQITDIGWVMTQSHSKMGGNTNRYLKFTTDNAQALFDDGIVPPGMWVNGNLMTRWGAYILFSNQTNGGQATLTASWPDVQTCVDITVGLSGYTSIVVGGTVFGPANLPDVVSARNACASNLAMTVTWS